MYFFFFWYNPSLSTFIQIDHFFLDSKVQRFHSVFIDNIYWMRNKREIPGKKSENLTNNDDTFHIYTTSLTCSNVFHHNKNQKHRARRLKLVMKTYKKKRVLLRRERYIISYLCKYLTRFFLFISIHNTRGLNQSKSRDWKKKT